MTKQKWGLVLLVVAALGGGLYYVRAVRPVSVVVAQPLDTVEVRVFGIGTVEAQVTSRVGFQVSGRIVALNADQGDVVEKGAVIARLDDSSQQAKVARAEISAKQAETQVAKAKAALAKAQVNMAQKRSVNQRRQSLVDRGSVSRETADDAQANADSARADADVAAAETEVAAAARQDAIVTQRFEKVTLDQHVLSAPFKARIIQRHKELGSIANIGETIFTLVEPASIWVRAFVDEGRAGGLELGQKAFVRLRSDPQNVVEAEVVRIDQENDRTTEERRIYVRCTACQPGHQLRYLGEQTEVEIVKKVLPRAPVVPLSAVDGFDGKRGRVWVLREGQLARADVEFGDRLLDGRLVVTSKLDEATRIVSQLQSSFREGRAANVDGSKTP